MHACILDSGHVPPLGSAMHTSKTITHTLFRHDMRPCSLGPLASRRMVCVRPLALHED